jgi:hypothetical protein
MGAIAAEQHKYRFASRAQLQSVDNRQLTVTWPFKKILIPT